MTTTTTTIELINKDNKKLLKNADSISFRLDSNGNSQLECNKKIKIDGFETDIKEIIPVGTYSTIYEGYGKGKKYEIEKAWTWITWSKSDMVWQTIVKNLKINDEIVLEWLAGNNSNVLDENNLSNDVLNMRIKRNGKLEMVFHIENSVTYKNSTARMITLREVY